MMARLLPAALAVALVACTPATDAPQEPFEKVLHRGNGLEPETLDPHRARSVETFHILRDLYEGLIAERVDGALGPGVAEHWEVSDDGLTWTFHLRADARWSNGDPVTAADFEWSLQRAVAPETGSQYAPMLAVIDTVEARGEHLLEITLTGPTPYLVGLLAQPVAFPVHRPSVEAHPERFTQPANSVTNGAYAAEAWVPQSHLRLRRNPYYWNDAATRIDAVVFYPIETESTELARYRAGDLHMTRTTPAPQFDWLRRNMHDQLKVTPYLSTYFYGFNLTRPPFADNLPLRKALSMAIDRKVITGQVIGAGEVPAFSWVPPGISDYTPQQLEWVDWDDARRKAEARRLYADAGYTEANPLKVELRYNTAESHKRIAVAVASMWRETLGVETTLVNEEWQSFLANRTARRLEVYRSGWVGDYNDANTFAEAMLPDHGLNDMGWKNVEYVELIEAAGRTIDTTTRRGLLERAERLMLDEHPIIPIYFYVSKTLVKPVVGGYEPNVMNVHPTRHLYIESD